MPSSFKGRCFGCGLLSKNAFEQPLNEQYFEATYPARLAGNLWFHQTGKAQTWATVPDCFVGQVLLIGELPNPLAGLDERFTETKKIIDKDRNCPRWIEYRPGLTPKEHLERQEMLELEEIRRQWERQLEQERRAWERQLEEDRRAWERTLQQESKEARDKTDTIMFRLTVAAVALAFAQVLAAVLALTPDAWWLKLIDRAL